MSIDIDMSFLRNTSSDVTDRGRGCELPIVS